MTPPTTARRQDRDDAPEGVVSRVDRVDLRAAGLAPAATTREGFLRLDAYLYRGGVQVYVRADGRRVREWRDPEAVLAPDVLARHTYTPLVNSHPTRDVEVTPDNASRLVVGVVGGDVRRDGNRARATVVVYDRAAIEAVRAGKRELSSGYLCRLDETPGTTPDGEPYDVRQYDWVFNHSALEERGRAGDALVRFDAVDSEMITDDDAPPAQETKMELEALKKALAAAEARADAAEKALAAATARADAAEKSLVTEREQRLDAAGKLDGAKVQMRARLALEQRAVALCPDLAARADSIESVPNRDLMVAVIKRVDGDDVDAKLSDSLVEGFYLSALRRADRGVADRQVIATRHVPRDGDAAAPKNSDQLREDAERGKTLYSTGGN